MATWPASVNLIALPTRLIRTCVKRRPSPPPAGSSGAISTLKASFLSAASGSSVLRSLGNVLNEILREFKHQLTGLDLGQIKHVIDEPEQVPAVGLKPFEDAQHLLGWLTVSAIRHRSGISQDGLSGVRSSWVDAVKGRGFRHSPGPATARRAAAGSCRRGHR